MAVRNEQKCFVAFTTVAGNSVFINPANVTRVEKVNAQVKDCVWIFTTCGGRVAVPGDIDEIVDHIEEGLV